MVRIVTFFLLILCFAANAQSVQQSGVITPGHAACWAITGVIFDCGAPGGGVSVVGSTTANDFAAFNGSGSLIDSGINPTSTSSWSGLQNFNGGATTVTRPPGDNTTNIATTAFVTTSGNNLLAANNTWTGSNYFLAAQGQGALVPQNPPIVMGQSIASASVWLGQFTYPYGPYAWITGQYGNGAQLLGNHSAEFDPTKSATLDLITSQVYGYHDNPIFTGYSDIWTNYWVAGKTATAYAKTNVQLLEGSIINQGGTVQASPVYVPDGVNDPIGATTGSTIDCGLGSLTIVGNTCTTALQIVNNTAAFFTGLRMTINSIVPSDSGFYEAIQLSSNPIGNVGPGHAIVWYTGTPCAPHPCNPSQSISGFLEVDAGSIMHFFGAGGMTSVSPLRTLENTTPATGGSPLVFSTAAGFGIWFGVGSPSSVVTAAKGSIYLEDGTGQAWVNTSGSTTWDQLASLTVAQTLTNKTLTSPIVTGGTFSSPAVSAGTFSGLSTFSGQFISTFGAASIASGACGATTNGTVAGTNASGLITIGSATTTTCTVSFSTTITAPGGCVAFPANAAAAATGTTVARVSSVGTTNFVITGSALANANYYYICL